LLAGVNLSLLQRPELYNSATSLLNAALDDSFDRDPIWGATLPGHSIMAAAGEAAGKRKPAKGRARKGR